VISFLIIAFTIFLVVRRKLNAAARREAVAVVATTHACQVL
jgi:large-conductance mechanosensitive channel